jgi:hypothetical protein
VNQWKVIRCENQLQYHVILFTIKKVKIILITIIANLKFMSISSLNLLIGKQYLVHRLEKRKNDPILYFDSEYLKWMSIFSV